MIAPMTTSTADGAPFPVFMAAIVGYTLAAALVAFGIIGFFADQVSNPFGGGLLVGGVVIGVATWLAARGNGVGRAILGLLAALTVVVAIVYLFAGPSYALIPCLVTAGVAAGTAALLYVPASAQRFYGR
jgi:hypothetical protein